MLIQGGLEASAYSIVAVSVLVSFLTLYSMIKIFRYGFWNEQQSQDQDTPGGMPRVAAVATLVGAGVVLGLAGTLAMPYATLAAEQLLDTRAYVDAVLAVTGPGGGR